MVSQQWRTVVRALVLHPKQPRLLLADPPPEAELPGRVEPDRSQVLLAALRDRAGLELDVLRSTYGGEDERAHRRDVQLLTVLRGPQPAGSRWVEADRDSAELVRLATAPGQRPAQPWLRRDWLPAAASWLASVLDSAGPVRQHKVSDLSCVLRTTAATGEVYLKATVNAPLFAPEAAVTVALNRLFPGQVPVPVGTDPGRGLLALADFGTELGWGAPVDVRAGALRRWARLQRSSVRHVPELLAAGCRDRRLGWLAGAVGEWFTVDTLERFTGTDVASRLAAAAPRISALCAELARAGLPDTLQHGDLHMSNVTRRPDGDYLFFDWTDAAVGQPFLDLIAVGLEDDPAARALLREAYLSEWPGGVGMLGPLWPLVEVLSAANQAISYLSLGLFLGTAGMPSPLFASFTVHWLDTILAALDRLGSPRAPAA